MAAFAAGAVVAALGAALLDQSCRDARSGSMPVRAYLTFRPDARLSTGDVETICRTSQKEVDDANDQGSRF